MAHYNLRYILLENCWLCYQAYMSWICDKTLIVRYDIIKHLNYKNQHRKCITVNFIFFSRFTYPSQNISLQTFVNSSSFPGGVAVDSANYHVYWVHDNGDTLSRCNLDGTNVVVLNSSSHTFSIRLDVQNRYQLCI